MSKFKAVVNVDLDGVVYPWHEQFATYVTKIRGNRGVHWWQYSGTDQHWPEPTTWDFWEQWDLTKDDFKLLFRNAVRDGVVWGEGRPLPQAQWLLGKLSYEGYFVRLVTTRLYHNFTFGHVQKLTAGWLDEWALPYRALAYVGAGESKGDYLADYAIDDSSENVLDMNGTGTDAFLLNRAWNQGGAIDGYWRVHGLREFYEKIEADQAASGGRAAPMADPRPPDSQPPAWAFREDAPIPPGSPNTSATAPVRWSDSMVREAAGRMEMVSEGSPVLLDEDE